MNAQKIVIEFLGYLGSVLVVVSMLMTSVMKLRIINTLGSIVCIIYALIIKSYPTALMNAFLIAINVYQMLRLRSNSKVYEAVELAPEDRYLSFFLDRYASDISLYSPDFRDAAAKSDLNWLVSCDGNPVGVVLGRKDGDCVDVLVDYTVPAYRDFSVGKYVYAKLKELGFTKAVWLPESPELAEYRSRMGFAPNADGVYEKTL